MAATNKIKERIWLNNEEHGGTAFIQLDNGELKIADCNRIVSLEFYVEEYSTLKDIDNVEEKIDILYEAVKKYRYFIKRRIKKQRKENGTD